jgi:7-keto-8-aminopelargonate synthetase-like enzyme
VQINHLPGRTLQIGQEEWLYFSGTAYLGLALHPQFQEHVIAGIRKYGLNFGGSRRSNMQLAIFTEVEEKLAAWLGTEAVLTVSSGSLAGQLLIKYLEQHYDCHYAPSIHPALLGTGTPFKGSQLEWSQYLLSDAFEVQTKNVILSSSLDPLYGESYDFQWLKKLANQGPTRMVIDDSHGLGILGTDGTGIIKALPVGDTLDCTILSSMGKALGVPGGLIAGSRDLIQQLWDSPFFGGASPIIPAYLHAFLHNEALIKAQRLQLQQNIAFFISEIPTSDYFQQIPEHPVFYIKEDQLAVYLQQNQIFISSFHYPSAQDPLVNRIVINAAHTRQDLEKLTTLICRYHERKEDIN